MENSIIQEDSNINTLKNEVAFKDCFFLLVDSVFNSFQMLFNKAWLFKAHSDCFMKK